MIASGFSRGPARFGFLLAIEEDELLGRKNDAESPDGNNPFSQLLKIAALVIFSNNRTSYKPLAEA